VTRRKAQLLTAHTVAPCVWQKAHRHSSHMFANRACSYSPCPAFPSKAFARSTCLQEGVDSLSSVGTSAYSHFFVHEIEVAPASTATVWAKHWMRAQDIHLHSMRSLYEHALHRQYAHAAVVCSACAATREAQICIQTVASSISW